MLKPIRHMFPPLVTVVVLMIGFILKVGFKYAGKFLEWIISQNFRKLAPFKYSGYSFNCCTFSKYGKGMVSAASILIGIIAGFIVAAMLGEVRYKNCCSRLHFKPQYGIDFVSVI